MNYKASKDKIELSLKEKIKEYKKKAELNYKKQKENYAQSKIEYAVFNNLVNLKQSGAKEIFLSSQTWKNILFGEDVISNEFKDLIHDKIILVDSIISVIEESGYELKVVKKEKEN